ncbi:hypothetical protein CRM22_002720 [Opisthorchis felineus]|uniref:Uncharacterized protein n=1 Tax=Opisthorchis felineus TaxID=147828 RepID=A0A4S2M983_OPIFE|nr:hypothetical protein CRM22_002720 [Opisthorchis felineus]
MLATELDYVSARFQQMCKGSSFSQIESDDVRMPTRGIRFCPLYCTSCQQLIYGEPATHELPTDRPIATSGPSTITELGLLLSVEFLEPQSLPIPHSVSERNLLHCIQVVHKVPRIETRSLSLDSLDFSLLGPTATPRVTPLSSDCTPASNCVHKRLLRVLMAVRLTTEHQSVSFHSSLRSIMLGISEVTQMILSLFDCQIRTHLSVSLSAALHILDVYTLLVNQIASNRFNRPSRVLTYFDLCPIHRVVGRIVRNADDFTWIFIATQLQRGILRIYHVGLFDIQPTEWNSTWCLLFAKLAGDSKYWTLYEVCVHELADLIGQRGAFWRGADSLTWRAPGASTIPPSLAKFVVDIIHKHCIRSVLLNDVSFCLSLYGSALFSQIWSALMYYFGYKSNPHFVPMIAFLWNKASSSCLLAFLRVFFSDLVGQIVKGDCSALLISRLKNFAEHIESLLTNSNREVFFGCLFQILVLPLCMHPNHFSPSKDKGPECFAAFLKLWVYVLDQSESFSPKSMDLAVASLKCLDATSDYQLASMVHESLDFLSDSIEHFSGLLLRQIALAKPKHSNYLWERLTECVVQLSTAYLQYCSQESPNKSAELIWHNLCRLIVAAQYEYSGRSAPVISFVKWQFMNKLHLRTISSEHTIVSLSLTALQLVINKECEHLECLRTEEFAKWCSRISALIWPSLFILSEAQTEGLLTEADHGSTPLLMDLFSERFCSAVQVLPNANSLLADEILPSLSSMLPASLPETTAFYGSPRLLILLLRALIRFAPEPRPISSMSDVDGIVHHPDDVDLWTRCATQLSSRLFLAVQSCSSKQLERDRQLLIKETLAILPARVSCSALSDAIIDILHAGLLGCGSSSTSVQLSPSHLEKIIGIIRDELKNSTNVVCVGCRKASFSSVAIKLLRLVTNWACFCDPLSPSSFITWPAFSSRTSQFSPLSITPDSARVLRRFHFASSWLSNSESFLINGPGEVSSSSLATAEAPPKNPLQPGFLASLWFRPPYTTNLQATPSVCDLEFVNMAELGELMHLFTLESISTCQLHFSQNIELCSPDWAFQVWFCVPYSMFCLRVSHRVCSSDTASSSEDASCSVREWITWIPFSCGRSTEIPLWHHALFQMSQKTESSIKVYLIVDGCFEHSTDVVSCQFKKFPVDKLETAFLSTHPSTGTFFHFGHNSGHPSQPHKIAIGRILFFEEKEDMFQSPVFDAHQLGLILTLLGPDWNGHFDLLECGARYSNMAWCILRSLVRRLFHGNVEENRVGSFFFEASNLISSRRWFHPARLLVQSSLFLVVLTEPPLRVLFRQQEQLPTASSDNLGPPSPSCDSDQTELWSHLFKLGSKSPKWLSGLAHVFLMYHPILGAFEETSQRTGLPTTGKSGNQVPIVPIAVTSQRKINIDHAFDPHGGLDVVLYLLGQAVSNEAGLLNNATDLQATLLDLLFSLLNGSASMSAYFGAPALSDPGTEHFIKKRRRRVAYRQAVQPLSVGDCFFARLIKHPKFSATSPQVTEVLLNQLFAFKEQSPTETAQGIPVASSPALLINPGLLRCFIVFGVQAFWCHISCFGEHCRVIRPEDLQKHLIPRALDLVYLTLSASSSTCSSLTACLIDRWQLLSVAFSAFREIFLLSQVKCPLLPDKLAVILAPLLILSVRRLTWYDSNAQSSAECRGVWSGDTELRVLFDGLCRLIIALDADMFLVAAEHVFSTIGDQSPSYGSVPSEIEILDSTWISWHKLTACCIRPERWLIWMRGATETNIQSNPPFSPALTRRSFFEQPEQQHAAPTGTFVSETATLNSQQHLKSDASDLVNSTSPSEEEHTATELEAITRYVDAFSNELERTHSMQSKVEGDSIETKSLTRSDLDSMEQLALRTPDEETQPPKEPLVISPNPLDIITGPPCKDQLDAILGHLLEPSTLGHHSSHRSVSDYPLISDSARERLATQLGALSPQDGAASESERNQMLAFAIVCALDYIWSSLLYAPYGTEARRNSGTNPTLFERLAEQLASTVQISVDQSIQQRLSSILRPPLWLVHSLLGHPCVHIREAGMNAYRVWLKHSRRPSPSQLSDLLIAQLLDFSPSFQAVDLKFRTRSSYKYRHLCSPTLLDRAFAMVFDGIVLSDNRNSSHSKTTRGVRNASQTLLDYLCRSDLSKMTVSPDQVPQEAKEQESDPVTDYISSNTPPTVAHLKLTLTFLLAIILGGFADAVMSISVGSIGSDPMVTTSEIELCADAVAALTNLLQFESSCLMPNALRAGLLPVLYNLAWILETGAQKQDMSFEKHPGSRFVLLTPILGGLCRLLARVIRWILLDATIPPMYVDCSCDLRFKLVTDFIRRLFTMYPGEKEISPSQAPIFNPGPVSCCLVRRTFYSLLDVLIQQLDTAGRDSMQTMEERFGGIRGSGAIKRLFEQLEWTVNNAVCTLTFPGVLEHQIPTGVTSTHKDFRADTDQVRFTFDNSYSDVSTRANNDAVEVPHLINPDYALSGAEHAKNQRGACYNPQSSNTRENLQRSLDQALVTAMFTSALNIQNGSLFHFSHTQPNCLSATDCLTMFCKALGRMLVTKTQPPIANVALDPTVNYLLRLFNEEPMLLRSCLNSLPRSFSLVFWGNLAELGAWLDTFVPSESDWYSIPNKTVLASSATSSTRSSSVSCQSVNFLDKLAQRQLEQLSRTVQSLIAVQAHISPFLQTTGQSSEFTFSPAMINKHRGLLISAQAKAHAQWSASMLPSPEVAAANGISQAKNKSKEQLPTLVNLLLQSFGSGLSPLRDSTGAVLKSHSVSSPTEKFSRRISTAHLASQAHRRCIEGHRAWKEAFGERLRIAGPLSTLLWARLADRLDHPSGIFYDPDSAPCVRCVDPLEGPMRQRRRMFYMHLPLADRLVHSEKQHILAHRRLPHPLASLIGLPSRIPKPSSGAACQWTHLPLFLPLPATPLVQLASASRHDALGVWACCLVGLVHIPPVEGDLILGDSWLRFQPDSSEFVTATAEEDSLFRVNPVARLWLAWPLSSIDHVEKRRYALRKLAVEIFPDGTSVNAPALFAMRSNKDRNHFIRTLREQMKTKTVRSQFLSTTSEEHPFGDESNFDHGHHRLRAVQRRWLKGQISNFAYLMELNDLAGRTYNDLMQYPIFPWVIQDYESAVLDLGHPNTYRKFDRPVAVQLDERAAAVSKHYDDAEQFAETLLSEFGGSVEKLSIGGTRISPKFAGLIYPPYHYPSHCSNEAIVLNFMVRLLPYTYRHLRFQDNNYDVPDRLFHSIEATWRLATTTVTCVKELLPEFYFVPELFVNGTGLALGYRQNGNSVDSIQLPPWSKGNPRFFTLICRAALESDYTTSQISHWIDLIFGYKQTGKRAKEALNLYHPYTYFGAIDVDQIQDPIRAQAVEAMINNYGQTPKQLFKRHPHPSRFILGVMHPDQIIASPSVECDPCTSIECHQHPIGMEHFENMAHVNRDDLDKSADAERLQKSSKAFEITPLETVIGLRWGKWAGSPQSPRLQVMWKVNASQFRNPSQATRFGPSHTEPVIGHLCAAVWSEACFCGSAMFDNTDSPTELLYTLKTLREAWSGFVQTTHSSINETLQSATHDIHEHSPMEGQDARLHWRWSILGCERLARIWLTSRMTNDGARLFLVKLFCSPVDQHTLHLRVKDLLTSESSGENVVLTLPVVNLSMKITALAVSQASRTRMQLYVGTSNGSVYVRRCPMELSEISNNGWFPKDFAESLTNDSQKTSTNLLGDTSHPRTSSQQTTSGHATQTCNEAGLWEVTGWRQLTGHAGKEITTLAACQQYGLLASGDNRGGLCLWDTHRLTLLCRLNTFRNSESYPPEPHIRDILLSGQDNDEGFSDVHLDRSPPRYQVGAASEKDEEHYAHCCAYNQIDGLCFSPTSGELAVSCWSESGLHACWIGVYSASGTQVVTRILDFMAEITDAEPRREPVFSQNSSPRPSIPMAYSTVSEGHGVNCLLLGGTCGRLVWLNSWTLDTVRTMLLPEAAGSSCSQITALSFVPAINPIHETGMQHVGEILCQGVCVSDQQGSVYYLAPTVRNQRTYQLCTCPEPDILYHGFQRSSRQNLTSPGIWLD